MLGNEWIIFSLFWEDFCKYSISVDQCFTDGKMCLKWGGYSFYSSMFEYLHVSGYKHISYKHNHTYSLMKSKALEFILQDVYVCIFVFVWVCDWKREWSRQARKASYELLPVKIRGQKITNQWCHLKFPVRTSNAVPCFCSYSMFHVFLLFSPKDMLTYSCFCFLPCFPAHHVLHKNDKERKTERHTRNLEKMPAVGFCLYFQPCFSPDSLKFLLLRFTFHLRDPLVFDNVAVQRLKPLLILTFHH